jgi:hypothetical protein
MTGFAGHCCSPELSWALLRSASFSWSFRSSSFILERALDTGPSLVPIVAASNWLGGRMLR